MTDCRRERRRSVPNLSPAVPNPKAVLRGLVPITKKAILKLGPRPATTTVQPLELRLAAFLPPIELSKAGTVVFQVFLGITRTVDAGLEIVVRGSLVGLPYCCSAGLTLATVVGEPHCCSVVTVNTSNTDCQRQMTGSHWRTFVFLSNIEN